MKKGFTKKRYQLILLIIPCIIILAYIYFTQSNKIDTIKLKRRLFTTYSPSKNHQLNVYTADTNKENASVLVELKNDQTKKNIYWQPNTSWAYIVWNSENIVYINGTKINLSKNKQYDERDNTGESFYSKKDNNPLYLSILKQEIDEQKIIKQLIDKSNINYADAQGNTMLMIAAGYGNQKLLNNLLAQNLKPTHKNRFGEDALLYAISKDQITTAKQLLEAGMDNQEALLKTAQTGNVKMAELVLKYLDLRSDWYIKQAVIEAMNEENEDYVAPTPTCCTGNRVLNDYFITDQPMTPVTPVPWKKQWIFDLADCFANGTPLHSQTWATHSCFLACGGELLFQCEDIGRHNALDKAIGYALRHNIDLKKCVVYSSGRIPTDMAIKAIRAGIPVLASKASPSAEAVAMAKEYHLTLICAARRDRMKLFTGNNPTE